MLPGELPGCESTVGRRQLQDEFRVFKLPFDADPVHIAAYVWHKSAGDIHVGQIDGTSGQQLDRLPGSGCGLPPGIEPRSARLPHERDVPAADWAEPTLVRQQLRCRGTGYRGVEIQLDLQRLQRLSSDCQCAVDAIQQWRSR